MAKANAADLKALFDQQHRCVRRVVFPHKARARRLDGLWADGMMTGHFFFEVLGTGAKRSSASFATSSFLSLLVTVARSGFRPLASIAHIGMI